MIEIEGEREREGEAERGRERVPPLNSNWLLRLIRIANRAPRANTCTDVTNTHDFTAAQLTGSER